MMQWGVATVPPPGKFLSPFTGFWKNAETTAKKQPEKLTLKGLQQPVEIVYDDRMVPHIFAQNEHDLYFAQGYVTAQHRLWQMEFQTHFAAGRISEIVGPKALPLDRMTRRKGLLYASEEALKQLESDPVTNNILDAYTAGVNAWIGDLTYRDYPVEYKLMNYAPEPWTKLKCALLLKYMADMLTGKSYDIELSNAVQLVGEEYIGLLYPDFPDTLASPIVPAGTPFTTNHFDLDTPSVPGIFNKLPIVTEKTEKYIGSNNWAVNGKKTKSGAPILCNDPHLGLNLPSIWYEVQLACPGQNTYGVSLPGAPAIVIGFNENIAWGVTNGTQDVKDWYKVKFRDDTRREYFFDGEWKPSVLRVEEIRIKGSAPFMDTVYYTHYGPVVYNSDLTDDTAAVDLAARWTGLDPSNELMTFYHLNKSANYTDYVNAIKTFQCPSQNFVFASRSGDIAIWQQGKFPVRWPLQGKFVMDGSSSIYQWQDYIPQEENPHALNPERNFVSSANQHPTDTTYPYYYTGWFEHYRNRRINERLDMMNGITVEDMMKLQNDNMNLQASECLPYFIRFLDGEQLNATQAGYLAELQKWNYMNDAGSVAAVIFEKWFYVLDSLTWDEFRVAGKMTEPPGIFTTYTLMRHYPDHELFDDKTTPDKTESFRTLIQESFVRTCASLEQWKSSGSKPLTWSNYKSTSIQHLSRLLAFSVNHVETGGNRGIVNATGSRWGPSWRMIVSLEEPIKAYGVYPGGQSGNPGSPYYATGIEKWSKGEYFELLFMKTATDQDSRILFKQTLIN